MAASGHSSRSKIVSVWNTSLRTPLPHHEDHNILGFPIVTMTCTKCGRTEPGMVYSRPRVYQLASTRLDMHCDTGWCFDCDCVRSVENLSPDNTINAIRRAAGALQSAVKKRTWFRKGIFCKSYHLLDQGIDCLREFHTSEWHALGRELDDHAARLVFLAERSVPARCLHCFGHNIVGLERPDVQQGKLVSHPGCEGNFVVEVAGTMSLLPPSTLLVYQADGILSHEEPLQAPRRDFAGKHD